MEAIRLIDIGRIGECFIVHFSKLMSLYKVASPNIEYGTLSSAKGKIERMPTVNYLYFACVWRA